MGKFLKCEFKGNYKTLLGFLLGGILASFMVQMSVYRLNKVPGTSIATVRGMMTIFGVIIAMAVMIGFIYTAVAIFGKEINSNTGYLTFQVPEKMWKMVAAKLIMIAICSVLYVIFGLLVNMLIYTFLINPNFIQEAKEITMDINFNISFKYLTLMVFEITSILSIIYFSMSLSKMTFKNKKMGWFWIVPLAAILYIVTIIKVYFNDVSNPFYLTYPVEYVFGIHITNRAFVSYIIFDAILVVLSVYLTGKILDKRINL